MTIIDDAAASPFTSLIVLAWLWGAGSGLGLLIALIRLHLTLGDRRIVRQRQVTNGRRILSRMNLVADLMYFVIMSSLLLSALTMRPLPPPEPTAGTHLRYAIFTLLSWHITLTMVWLLRERLRLVAFLKETETPWNGAERRRPEGKGQGQEGKGSPQT